MVILTHLAGKDCPWQIIALVRAVVPLVLLAAWARLDGVRLVFWGPPVLWMRSIAGSCSLIGSFYSLTHMPPAEANCLQNAFPIWVALLSWPLLGEWPSRVVWLSAITGVCGVILVQRPDLDGVNPTALVAVAVSVFTALAMMGLHRLRDLDPRVVVVHFSGVSVVFSIAALVFLPGPSSAPAIDWPVAAMLLGVGVTATIGQLFLTKAFAAGAGAGFGRQPDAGHLHPDPRRAGAGPRSRRSEAAGSRVDHRADRVDHAAQSPRHALQAAG